MSVYLPRDKARKPKTQVWQYDFRLKPKGAKTSQRFFGSTGQKKKLSAERVETRLKELAKLGQLSNAMTVADGCRLYWEQRMQFVLSADDQATNLETISTYLGGETPIVSITPAMVAEAASMRARTPIRRYNRRTGEVELTKLMPSQSTVNRQFTQPLRRFLKYCRITLKVPVDLSEFEWGGLLLPESEERNREIGAAEEIQYWSALRADYHPIVELYLLSGRRRSDWVGLRKDKVGVAGGIVTVRVPSRKKKKRNEITVTLTDDEARIVMGEMKKSPGHYVFTYEVQKRTPDGRREKGDRLPITWTGLRRSHGTACKRAGIADFRIHDYRHTMATRLMRESRNPKLVQKALDHASMSTTGRYMHVLDVEVVDARSKITTYRRSPGVVALPRKARA